MSRVLLFGKLPAHGDFVSRGWAPLARDALDDWLSGSLADARDAAGATFDERYDLAPPWRCLIPAKGELAAGALAASQDAAGRRYPVLLMLRGGGDRAAAACEALLYDAIAGGWSADMLVEQAEALAETPPETTDPRWWTLGGEGFAAATLPGAHPAGLMMTMVQGREAVS
ncbi:type VI secretion system ImpM family protein [Sphingomonas sp. UYAg733]